MRATLSASEEAHPNAEGTRELFIVVCASGFENSARARSALMFAALAATGGYKTVLYCIQNAVDIMVRGSLEKNERPQPGVPSLAQRLNEALDAGVEIHCCTQSMANKHLSETDLIDGARAAGAMSLIVLAAEAKGTISF
ncbi:MAG: DsrE family protein [Nitrospiraceae bacterium]|nr:DsrE family protein [Nitrospiraceae bacterium]